MNKLVILALLIVSSASVFSKETETVIVLLAINARGVQVARDVVMVNGGSVMINALKLTPGEIITQSPYIKKIASFKKTPPVYRCEEGSFQHILKKGAVEKKETGCLGSSRYKELKDSFMALKKDPTAN